jgi:exopolysaccharide production protein ExoQ
VKRLLALTGFALIPASVLLVKYYPELGRQYDRWIGTAYYSGVASDKNGLGFNCLIFGLASVWRVVSGLQAKVRNKGQLMAHLLILGMVLWLLGKANSSTSLACFMLGSALIIFLSMAKVEKPAVVHTILASVVAAAAVGFMARDVFSYLVSSLGRDTTLTGRVPLWEQLLKMNRSPWFGTGFESFFLGERAERLWSIFTWHPNEAHNGYLELYLNLGIVGLGLFLFVIMVGYRNVVASFKSDRTTATLKLAFLIAALIYNSTEAAFKIMHPVWIVFLFAVTAVPNPTPGTPAASLPNAAPTSVPSQWSASRSPRWRRQAS